MERDINISVCGPSTLLFFIFLTLKLTSVITWSWWWVTAPLWIPFGIAAVVIAVFALVLLVLYIKHN